MKTILFSFLVVAALVFVTPIVFSQQSPAQPGEVGTTPEPLGQVRPMTVAFAKQLVAAAIKSSCSPPQGSCSGAFCVVDDAGTLLYMEVIEGTLSGGPELCIEKAETPALWRRPTRAFGDAVKNNQDTSFAVLGANPYMTTSPGGVPIFRDGRVVGGFGQAANAGGGNRPWNRNYVPTGYAETQIIDAVIAEATKIFGKQGR